MFTTLFEASTAHITPETDKWLTENAGEHNLSFIYDILPHGYLFHITDHAELADDRTSQIELIELIEGVLKLSPNCTHLVLDADGPICKMFETFDWEPDKIKSNGLTTSEEQLISAQIMLGGYEGISGDLKWSLSVALSNIAREYVAKQILKGEKRGDHWSLNSKRLVKQ